MKILKSSPFIMLAVVVIVSVAWVFFIAFVAVDR